MSTTPVASETTEEGRAFLQRRVISFALVSGGAFLLFWIYRAILISLGPQELATGSGLLAPDMNYHLAGSLSLLAIAGSCRLLSPRPRVIRWIEGAGLVLTTSFMCGMAHYIPATEQPGLIVAFAMGLGVITRSVYVPSTPRHTAFLCLGMGIPIVATQYLRTLDIPVEMLQLYDPETRLTREAYAPFAALYIGMWWLITSICTVAASWVTYGLRRKIRQTERLGQYVLEERLGAGGMGEVYRAKHAMLRRPTAVKLIHPELVGTKALSRFEREVTLTAGLNHPNTVTIFDYGRTLDGIFYYAMELLNGPSLQALVEKEGPVPEARVVHILRQAASALTEAHGVGLIHRDIKPANIILCQKGGIPDVVQVLDFGLVKDLKANTDMGLTNPEIVTGTPQYMAPEAITAPTKVDGRSDLYSLGAVGYYLLTGQHVFSGETMVEVCAHHMHTIPVPPHERLGAPVDRQLEALILKCLAKKPEDRPQSASELEEELDRLAQELPWKKRVARDWWANWEKRRGAPLDRANDHAAPHALMTVEVDSQRQRAPQ